MPLAFITKLADFNIVERFDELRYCINLEVIALISYKESNIIKT